MAMFFWLRFEPGISRLQFRSRTTAASFLGFLIRRHHRAIDVWSDIVGVALLAEDRGVQR
jgi:hypothetical protein